MTVISSAGLPAVAVACIFVAGCITSMPAMSAGADEEGIIERLRDFVFPRSIEAAARTRAFEYRDAGYKFDTLSKVKQYYRRGADRLPDSRYELLLQDMPLESPYWVAIRQGGESERFIEHLYEVLSEFVVAAKPRSREMAPLQKMLLQRDLVQIYWLAFQARQRATPSKSNLAGDVLTRLSLLIESTLLDPQEYRALISSRPRSIPEGFTSTFAYSLAENYLPAPVFGATDGWLQLTNRGTPFRHFEDYRGRSFVKVYLQAESMSTEQLQTLRQQLYDKYGDVMYQGAVQERVPKRMITVLLRTTGVMLRDGTYRDAFWPEEVIVRAFKYPIATLDLETSDFSGTLFYQYKLSRQQLLEDPNSLGLVRVRDDDAQFFGFFGNVPDPRNSYSNTTTTMRENCILCHSEVFYGIPTIFSLGRDPEFELQRDDNEFWTEMSEGIYLLRSPEYKALAKDLQQLNLIPR